MESSIEDLRAEVEAQRKTIEVLLDTIEARQDVAEDTELGQWAKTLHFEKSVERKVDSLSEELAFNSMALATTQSALAFLQLVIDGIDAQVAIVDKSGTFIATNSSWSIGLEPGAEFAQGSALPEVVHGRGDAAGVLDIRCLRRGVARVCDSGDTCFRELITMSVDGRQHAWDLRITAVDLPDGLPGAVVAIIDVTERERLQAKLDEKERESGLLALLAKHTSNAVVVTDADAHIEWVNEGFTRLTGFSADEVLGRRPQEFLHGERTSLDARRTMAEAVRDRTGCKVDIVNYHKDGSDYWLRIEIVPIIDPATGTQKFMAIESDITKDREDQATIERLLATIREEVHFIESVLKTVPQGVFWTDAQNVLLGCNAAFISILGASSFEELVGRKPSEWFGGVDANEALGVLSRETVGFEDDHATFQIVTKAGEARSIACTRRGFERSGGGFTGLVGVLVDTTETDALRLRLNESRKLESLGALAAGIAHEINTPTQYVSDNVEFVHEAMTALQRFVTWTRDREAGEGAVEGGSADDISSELDLDFYEQELSPALDQCREGLQRIATIVQAMKDFSHPGGDSMLMEDLNEIVRATSIVARSEWKYIADLELELDDELPKVECDRGELGQVVLNLVVNASHAIADRYENRERGTIVVRSYARGERAILEIVDDGAGIPAEIQDRIFDPFFTTKEVGQGTGQGLAVSYNVIVNKHGGEIDVESTEGVGSTFRLSIPLQQPANSRETTEAVEAA